MTQQLQFTPLPDNEWTPTFMSLPLELEDRMKHAPLTLERLNGCLYLAFLATSVDANSKYSAVRAGACFRGALAEYASVYDMAKLEFSNQERRINLQETENPLPHILKLLRHLQVHFVSTPVKDKTVSLWLKKMPDAKPVDCIVWYIEDLTPNQFLGLRAFKAKSPFYSPEQAELMIEWLKAAQAKFGIADVIWRGVVEIAERLVDGSGDRIG